jgi:hypothetical protein
VGAFYDVAYDRSLSPPKVKTGNGVLPGLCPNDVGTRTEYEEGIDIDQSHLNGGGTDGQANAIDPDKLERDPKNGCKPVFPYNFVRTNTVFRRHPQSWYAHRLVRQTCGVYRGLGARRRNQR